MSGNEPQREKQILIVDDDISIRHMLGRVLADEGYGVISAASGEDGLKLAEGGGIDLVLLDLKMPGIGGQETFRLMRRARPGLPVIIISAYSRRQFAELGGACALLQKPLDFPTLLDTIKSILSQPVALG
jgi:DNA-binding NtrC family response regulator